MRNSHRDRNTLRLPDVKRASGTGLGANRSIRDILSVHDVKASSSVDVYEDEVHRTAQDKWQRVVAPELRRK